MTFPSQSPQSQSLKLLLVAALLGTSGCADVTIRKVPTPTQYVHWTDEMQRQADGMGGIRFYLPRPFVNVFESFPIRTDVYFVNGVVSPDGKYVLVDQIQAKSGQNADLTSNLNKLDPKIQIPVNQILAPKSLQGDNGSLNKGGAGPVTINVPSDKPAAKSDAPAAPATPMQVVIGTTGQNQKAATNDNGAFAYQPLRGNFDLVYVPDFEEQYCVDSVAGLGNAKFQVNLGQGWSLQGFNSLSDNSEINKRVFDLIDTSLQLAKEAASGALGNFLPMLTGSGVKLQGDVGSLSSNQKAGTPVSLKVVVVYYAAKGLYPVLKPRELADRVVAKAPQAVFNLADPNAKLQSASELQQLKLAQGESGVTADGSSTIPRYPYQYISFNTFRYLAVQVIQPGDDPFKVLYDRTGTRGDNGDARTGDILDAIAKLREMYASAGKGGGGQDAPSTTDIQKLMSAIAGQITIPKGAKGAGQKYYEISKTPAPTYSDGVIKVTLTAPNGAPDMTQDAANDAVKDAIVALQSSSNLTSIPVNSVVATLPTVVAPVVKPAGPAPAPAATPPGQLNQNDLNAFYGALKDPMQVSIPKPGAAADDKFLVVKTASLDSTGTGVLTVTLAPGNAQGPPANDPVNSDSAQLLPQAKRLADKIFPPGTIVVTKIEIKATAGA